MVKVIFSPLDQIVNVHSLHASDQSRNVGPLEIIAGPTATSLPGIHRKFANRRLAREWKTVSAMLHIYCRDHHGEALCKACQELHHYARLRLDRCRFGEDKPTCAKCPVHCYQRERREQIKHVMRYAGPRMLWEHPWLSVRHLVDGWRRNFSPRK